MKLLRFLLLAQGIYTLATALWPLLDITSFMLVTGPKTDTWLVKTVGALLIPVSITLLFHLFTRSDMRPAILLGTSTSLAFACIDFYYALSDVIPDIYLADGILQILFLAGWIIAASTSWNKK